MPSKGCVALPGICSESFECFRRHSQARVQNMHTAAMTDEAHTNVQCSQCIRVVLIGCLALQLISLVLLRIVHGGGFLDTTRRNFYDTLWSTSTLFPALV